ncbi:MAG: BolA/IbaG family iron-sulfur metabolism protein [Pseudomonadales bacterium]
MNEAAIRQLLEAGLDDCELEIIIDGNKLGLAISSSAFEGLNRVKRQQLVYGLLNDRIGSGEIHAVSMKCIAPSEQQ